MKHWQCFADPRFKVRFAYPHRTPQGHIVVQQESQRDDAVRVHFTAQGSRELYIEVVVFRNLTAGEEYERHTQALNKRPEHIRITALQETRCGSAPAYEYRFTLPDKVRVALLIEHQTETYRIIYDPQSPLNEQVLSTLTFDTE